MLLTEGLRKLNHYVNYSVLTKDIVIFSKLHQISISLLREMVVEQ